jgi:hypothetical protein
MSRRDAGSIKLEYAQELFMVVGGKDQQNKMLFDSCPRLCYTVFTIK